MEANSNKSQPKLKQNEDFWKRHYEQQKSSGITRVNYCHQHNLNYDRFGYWISRWNKFRREGSELVSVKLKSTTEQPHQSVLCTIDLKNGSSLKIHDAQALSVILEKFS